MKNLLILIIALLISQPIYAQRTEKSYYGAYLVNTESTVRIAKEQQLKNKSIMISEFLRSYPVLENLNNFSKNEKYSIINADLVSNIEDTKKYKIYHLKNGYAYKIKKKNQLSLVM